MPITSVDATPAASAQILGVGIGGLTRASLLQLIANCVDAGEHATIYYANAHALNLAYEQLPLQRIFNQATYVVCDGFGVKWAARFLGHPVPVRLTPPDWLPDILALAQQREYSVYFLGNRPGVAERAAATFRLRYPALRVAGTHHGFFDKTNGGEDNERVVRLINAARPNLLYVGFGTPAQEYWLTENWDRLDVNVAITVGAMLDFVAGEMPRGPRWMTDRGLEWLTRLVTEPRRLWRRYLIGIPLFFSRVVRQRLGLWRPE